MEIQGLGATGFMPASHELDPLEGPAPDHVSTVVWTLSSREERADLLAKGPPLFGAASLAASEAAPVQPNPSEALARKLVHAAGSGDQGDVDLVVAQLSKLPPAALQVMVKGHTQVLACRGSVSDAEPHIHGGVPRGWAPGSDVTRLPGVYDNTTNKVVIAVAGHGTAAGAHVPLTGEGHGSSNLVIHEALHAVDADRKGGPFSRTAAFTAARAKDLSALMSYERQVDPAGPQETFAESGAQFYGGDTRATTQTPALAAYWRSDPLSAH